jgi:DNA-binding CsgD family transcriptional regulator
MQTRMPTQDLQSLRMKMIKLAQGNTSACYWGEFRLSVLQGTEQETTDQMLYMVQITEKAKLIIDHEFILTHFDLSPAEANIALWLMRGLSDQAIAEHTCRSIWTIRAQMKSILSKLRVGSRSEITHLITSTVTEIHPPRSSKTHQVSTTSPLLNYLEKTSCQ